MKKNYLASLLLIFGGFCAMSADNSNYLKNNPQLKRAENYKWYDGSDSYLWEAESDKPLLINTGERSPSGKNQAISLWIYSTKKLSDGKLRIEFLDAKGATLYSFDYLLNYTKWRPLRRHYTSIKGFESGKTFSKIRIVPEKFSGVQKLYLRDLNAVKNVRHYWGRPSLQMPEAGLSTDNQRGKYYDSYTKLQNLKSTAEVTKEDLLELAKIREQALEALCLEENKNKKNWPWSEEDIRTKSESGLKNSWPWKTYARYGLHYDSNGNPVLKEIKKAGGFFKAIQYLAYYYKLTKSKEALEAIELSMRHWLETHAAGSQEHVGLAGYGFGRSWHEILVLMKDDLDPELIKEFWDMGIWYMNSGYMLMDDPRNNTDWMGTKSHFLIYYALFTSMAPGKQIDIIRGYHDYIDRFIADRYAREDNLKPDGSCFHHEAHYISYSLTSHWKMISNFYILRGTSFQMKKEPYEKLKAVLRLNADNVQNASYFPWTMNSRKGGPQTYGRITIEEWKKLAKIGGAIYGKEFDPEVAAIANRMYPEAKLFDTPAESSPEGFWQQNYATAGFYRKNDWLAYMRGFTNKLWGTEIAAGVNRYSYFQGHGGLEILYPGSPAENGYQPKGWNYNLFPGTTSFRMSPEELKAATKGKSWVSYYQKKSFCGAVAFGSEDNNYFDTKGSYGIFGFDFESKFLEGFSFKKTYFCLNDKYIVCLISDLNAKDKKHPAITTLFQRNGLKDMKVVLDGQLIAPGKKLDVPKKNHWLLDPLGTGYWVKDKALKVANLEEQTYPLHDDKGTGENPAAWAYIDQGVAPKNAAAEFVAVPGTNEKAMKSWAANFQKNQAYQVLQQNGDCHAVKDLETGLTGLAIYKPDGKLPMGFIKNVSQSCLIVYKLKGQELELAVSNPKLNVTGWKNKDDFQTVNIILEGKWQSTELPEGAQITEETDQTLVSVKTQYGKRYLMNLQNPDLPDSPPVSIVNKSSKNQHIENEKLTIRQKTEKKDNQKTLKMLAAVFIGIVLVVIIFLRTKK